jgi:hypothetical protein
MEKRPNFILVPDEPERGSPRLPTLARTGGKLLAPVLAKLRVLVATAETLPPNNSPVAGEATPVAWTGRPRLIFGFDATASREPAWEAARQVTDALVRALPGELDVALAVHGGGRLHTFTNFTTSANRLRDRAAAIGCISGPTQMLPILYRALASPGVRVVVYIGDVFEESPGRGRKLADQMGRRGIKLIVLHDVADWLARRDAELFLDLARRTGGCVLPFDTSSLRALRDLLAAVAVYAVGGEKLLEAKRNEMAGVPLLQRHLQPER